MKQLRSSGSPFENDIGFSRGLRCASRILVSQLLRPECCVEIEVEAVGEEA
jgi:hypothetical protein